jgi:hypothetical protein
MPSPDTYFVNGEDDMGCTSDQSCMAVGQGTAGPSAEVWNGNQWSAVTFPDVGFTGSISCSSPSWCVDTPLRASGGNGMPELVSWDGQGWTLMATAPLAAFPSYVRGGTLLGVSCLSRDWCVVVGSVDEQGPPGAATVPAGPPLVEMWNGRAWSRASVASSGNGVDSLQYVSCTTTSWCMATGSDAAGGPLNEVWDGHSWSIIVSPTQSAGNDFSNDFSGVSCTSSTWCMEVGQQSGGGDAQAWVWNGESWASDSSGLSVTAGTGGFIHGVVCTAPGSCRAIIAPGGPWLVDQLDNGIWSNVDQVDQLDDGVQTIFIACNSTDSCLTPGF